MSTPIKLNRTKSMRSILQNSMDEVVSAQSALNMLPEPIEPINQDSKPGYLSQTDAWAQHSMEHLRNIFAWQRIQQDKFNLLEDTLFQLYKVGKMNSETLNTLLEILKGPLL